MTASMLWTRLRLPLLVLVLACAFVFGARLLDLPTGEALADIVSHYFDLYGYWVILISAIVEGTLLAGFYYPGSIVIFLGVITAAGDVRKVLTVVAVTTLGLVIAHTANYLLGRHGWYRVLVRFGLGDALDKAQKRVSRFGFLAIAMAHWHPNVGAIVSTASGILRMPFLPFFIFTAGTVLLWDIFWGALAYVVGETAYAFIGGPFMIVAVLIWIGISVVRALREPRAVVPTV